MADRKERCERCKWYSAFPIAKGQPRDGKCHRYPPKITRSFDPWGWGFPGIDASNFCGEFTPTDEEKHND